jgi:CDP-diacylglycerol--glycerol-3-phosphate 3-phosphatidyltransferase
MAQTDPITKMLRLKWFLAACFGLLLLLGFYLWLRSWWPTPNPERWLLIATCTLVYLLWILWHGLSENRRQDEEKPLPALGLGNLISITRGFIMVIFCGFLFSPWPDQGWTAWLPGLLFTFAALPDFVDGIAARLTNHVTKLGEILDISIDSLGVLSVSLLSVQYGQVPWWFLLVGLSRYIFLGGIWLRQKWNLPVYDLAFSVRRRGYAALIMGFFFVILYPVFTPPGTHIVAIIFAGYSLGGFLWDWLITIGKLPADPGKRYRRLENRIVGYAPLFLRALLILWIVRVFLASSLSLNQSGIDWLHMVAVLGLILGVAGRLCSIVALVTLGLRNSGILIEGEQVWMLFIFTNLLFLGTGKYSLWPVENKLIFQRIGDST